jgi:hypothetical protein
LIGGPLFEFSVVYFLVKKEFCGIERRKRRKRKERKEKERLKKGSQGYMWCEKSIHTWEKELSDVLDN